MIGVKMYLVIDHPWNRENCPDLIGTWYENPPSYCAVQEQHPIDEVDREFYLDIGGEG
jgi:hypothetical protein